MQFEHYFDDLVIYNVHDEVFPYREDHAVLTYSPNLFSMEMIYEGEVDLHIENEVLHLKSPVVFCTGGSSRFYFFKHTGRGNPYRHLWIDFQGERGKRIYQAFFHAFPDGKVGLPSHIAPSVYAVFEEMLHAFHDAEYADHNGMVLKMEQLMYFLLTVLPKKTASDQDPFHLRELYESIQLDPMAEYDLEKKAGERHISSVYLRKLFRDRYGTSIGKYISAKRLERSAILVSERKYRISEIGDLCGFSNPSAFTRAFRGAFGISPYEFQKRFPAKSGE